MDNNELPFTDIITGAIGFFSLVIIILVLNSIINAKITLNINASVVNDKYPVFVTCDGKNLGLVCRSTYLPTKELQIELNEMCEALKLAGIQEADFEQRWSLLSDFFSSSWFRKDKFYVFSFIRPDGISTYERLNQMLSKNNIDVGYIPIAKDWDIREALKIDK